MRILSICLLIFTNSFSFSQQDFTITGKIERLSKAKQITINCSGGQFIAEIKVDGSFEIQGNVPEPGAGLIFTDSSGADAIWLEQGLYKISCKEVKIEFSKNIYFRIPELKGPKDAEIHNAWCEPRYYFRGSPDELRKKYKDHAVKYLDSLFTNFPECKATTEILRLSKSSIGDEAAELYMSMLGKEHLKDDNFRSLEDYFKRKEKIENEKFFQDFEMKDDNGKNFKLSSVKKKLILIDFWSSDCGPCRGKHPGMAELYKKYSDKGFEIISISLDDTKADWKKAIEKDKMIWINVSDLKGWNSPIAENYFVHSIPFSMWLDKDKKIISIVKLSEDEIKKYLD